MNIPVTGYWTSKKVKIKQRYPFLKDEDLEYSDGKEKEMMETLGYKLGISKLELLKIIVML